MQKALPPPMMIDGGRRHKRHTLTDETQVALPPPVKFDGFCVFLPAFAL
jgi:hypothetical protein